MKDIKNEISNAKYVCTTADIWNYAQKRISKKYSKEFRMPLPINDSHTHDRIMNILNKIHSKFEITSEKLIATVTDNGSNFVKAFQKSGVHIDESLFYEDVHQSVETVSFEGIISPLLPPHQRCDSHTLHLVVTTDILNGQFT
ncbi:uncharacterized protein LOC112552391 [Pogonomyrmex barbatus]|uniref:Uncharacterized protein LOC112552391 n=1 Tax=Pogonomyrmex barbatus TaxID=144034 RepID=A0A8N1S5D3_9HYME|nr:uncharacterized protein LOC112552391 [Pogonomyrmex barbatus]